MLMVWIIWDYFLPRKHENTKKKNFRFSRFCAFVIHFSHLILGLLWIRVLRFIDKIFSQIEQFFNLSETFYVILCIQLPIAIGHQRHVGGFGGQFIYL